MSVKCGHCKGRHVYVSDVRECAYNEYDDAAQGQAEYEAYIHEVEQTRRFSGFDGLPQGHPPIWR